MRKRKEAKMANVKPRGIFRVSTECFISRTYNMRQALQGLLLLKVPACYVCMILVDRIAIAT